MVWPFSNKPVANTVVAPVVPVTPKVEDVKPVANTAATSVAPVVETKVSESIPEVTVEKVIVDKPVKKAKAEPEFTDTGVQFPDTPDATPESARKWVDETWKKIDNWLVGK